MPITIRDDDVNGRPAFTIRDDDTRRRIMAIKVLSEGGTGSDMSATGPGLVQQASAGANFSTLTLAAGSIAYGGVSGVPTAMAVNATSTRKFLMEYKPVSTPIAGWDTIAATDITSGVLSQARGGIGDTTTTGPGVLIQSTLGGPISITDTPTVSALYVDAGAAAGSTLSVLADASQSASVELAYRNGSPSWTVTHALGGGGAQGPFKITDAGTGVNAIYIDTADNVGIGGVSSFGTSATKALGLGNGVAPTTSPADSVILYSTDISGGDATLGIRTEKAVVTESVTSDRTLSIKINGTTYKLCLKV